MTDKLKEDKGYIKRDICFTNNLDVIKLLLEEGLDINEWGICGHTPLHLYVKEGNFEIVKYLLSKGADINKKNIYGDNVNLGQTKKLLLEELKFEDNPQYLDDLLEGLQKANLITINGNKIGTGVVKGE